MVNSQIRSVMRDVTFRTVLLPVRCSVRSPACGALTGAATRRREGAAEEELLDAATAAQTVTELNAELAELAELVLAARRVREAGTDRKWTELSMILRDNALAIDHDGWPRKFIIFTEHRDTLDYLRSRIGSLLGKPSAVKAARVGAHSREGNQGDRATRHRSRSGS